MDETKDFLFESELLGKLYLDDILLYYGYPRCFVCKNEKSQEYLFYEVASNDRTDAWIVCSLSGTDLDDIKSKRCSIQDVYKRHRCIELTYDYETCSSNYIFFDNVLSMLPKTNVYYDPEI